jgi:NSS family neurotransmitter:Na+ symporter
MSEIPVRPAREKWTTRLGVVLAVAGSAVGLGNFLRFPVQAAQNGGGAFMIPYFIAFLLLGIPLCWVEWTMGRHGGHYSHGSAPGIFNAMGRGSGLKYFGALGILGPLLIFFYYTYVESWTLGYCYFSFTGDLTKLTDTQHLRTFLNDYQGLGEKSLWTPYAFYLITFLANFVVIYLGVARGIERVSKIAMPLLAILGLILVVRVLTLGTPNPSHPDWNVKSGLGFMWNPDWRKLQESKVWLAAAGQIFFTLSVGIGVILTYASYLRKNDDVVLSGLSASSTNEFMEVIVGGSVVIVAACTFYGVQEAAQIARGGSFNLGFVTMPLIFGKMLGGPFFCVIWFALLFIAGITSSISLLQPAISFLEDEFSLNRRQSVVWIGLLCFLMSQLAIFGLRYGVLDEMDFWGGTFLLVVFGLIEAVIFSWIFGFDFSRAAWKELAVFALCAVTLTAWLIELPPYLSYVTGWFPRLLGPHAIAISRIILGMLYIPLLVWLQGMSKEKKQWFYRIDQGWQELHRGADLRVPIIYKVILKYITPLYILIILWRWLRETGVDVITLRDVPAENYFHILSFRLVLVLLLAGICFLIYVAWVRHRERGTSR